MGGTHPQEAMTSEGMEIETLKAAYWSAVAASGHTVFSAPASHNPMTDQTSTSLSAQKMGASSPLSSTSPSQWLLVSESKSFRRLGQSLPEPARLPADGFNADGFNQHSQRGQDPHSQLPDVYRATLKPIVKSTGSINEKNQTSENPTETKMTQANLTPERTMVSRADVASSFWEQYEGPQTKQAIPEGSETGSSLAEEQPDPLDWVEMSARLDQGFWDNDSSPLKNHWTSKLLNNPRMVAALIGLCLLGSSLYAGLGYWWLTSVSLSHAAEPENGKSPVPSRHSDLLNIQTLQEQWPKQKPAGKLDPDERLIAQAAPAQSFGKVDTAESIPGLSGRPDPFSPLIQETNGAFIVPAESQDALTGVQYTGFIGGANSKSKIAIIKVADVNPAVAPKTLFKKAGESFYVNGQRIYLTAIGKTGLSLQLNGENRTLGLNPYKVVVNATTTSGTNLTAGNAGNGMVGGTAPVDTASVSSPAATGSASSFANPFALEVTGTRPPNNSATIGSTPGSAAVSTGNGININLEE